MPRLAQVEVATDGRRARGERTRLRVIEALLELLAEGEVHPTAQDVAARAGVALRTVYHHFEDVEALRRTAFVLQLERHQQAFRPIDSSLSLEERVGLFARQCRRVFEAITPIRRAVAVDEGGSYEMATGLEIPRLVRRNHLEASFQREVTKLGGGRTLLDAADAACSWRTWYYLREGLHRSAAAAEATIVLSLTSILSQPSSRRG